MRINYDLRMANGVGGISGYKRNIASELLNMNSENLDVIGCFNMARGVSKKNYAWFHGELRESVILDKFVYDTDIFSNYSYERLMRSNADVNYFATYQLPNVKFLKPTIATIHDIILLKTNCESADFVEKHRFILNRTVRESCSIFTVSESSKYDLCENFDLHPENVHIVHNGIDIMKFSQIDLSKKKKIREKYSLPERYILYLGVYRKHKNVEGLFKAYAQFSQKTKNDVKLVVTNTSKELIELAADLKIEDNVIFTGFVDEEEKAYIYNMATLCYYASFYEGFGVPIIEAQASKVPVLTSNTSSMPEASGGAALLVDPYNTDEIRDALLEGIENTKLRSEMIENGFKNAQKYTWKNSAKELYQAMRTVV